MNDLKIWESLLTALESNQPALLLLVLESTGSSPGRQGFKMAVTPNGLAGSIGGGVMEYKFVELAKEKLREKEDVVLLKKQIHNKVARKDQSGMICSGEQTIFMYPLSEYDLDFIRPLIASLRQKKNGTLNVTPKGIQFLENIPDYNFYFEQKSESDFYYSEKTGYKNQLYIAGGGHCALALSRLMSAMDFKVHLFDDRPGLNTFESNEYVFSKQIIENYHQLGEWIPSGTDHYVVIMTFGYRTDDLALRSVINGMYKYLGVLGSKSKMKQLMEEWRRDNLPENKLAQIRTPIGLPINSQSPEEIAVSIAAEIIQIKNS